jgi:hypothetical protein
MIQAQEFEHNKFIIEWKCGGDLQDVTFNFEDIYKNSGDHGTIDIDNNKGWFGNYSFNVERSTNDAPISMKEGELDSSIQNVLKNYETKYLLIEDIDATHTSHPKQVTRNPMYSFEKGTAQMSKMFEEAFREIQPSLMDSKKNSKSNQTNTQGAIIPYIPNHVWYQSVLPKNNSSSELVISGSQINSLQTKLGKTITVKIPKKFLKDPSPGSMKALALVLNHKLNMLLIDDNANNDSNDTNETSVDNEDIDDKVKAFCDAVSCDPGERVWNCYMEKVDHFSERNVSGMRPSKKFYQLQALYNDINNPKGNFCPTTNVTTGPIGPSNTVKTVSGNVAVINDSEPSNLGLGSTIRDTSTDTSSNKSSSSSSSTVPSREISSSSSSYNLSTISDGNSIPETIDHGTSNSNSIPETIDDGTSMPDTIETHLNTSKHGDHPANGKNEINTDNYKTMENTLQKYWSAMIKKTELSIEFNKKIRRYSSFEQNTRTNTSRR